jgi:glutamyl-tRNA reductase
MTEFASTSTGLQPAGRSGERRTDEHETPPSTDSNADSAPGEDIPRSIRRITCFSVADDTHSPEQVAAVTPQETGTVRREIHESERVTESVVLDTCNRVEVYVATRTPGDEDRQAAVDAVAAALPTDPDPDVYTGSGAVEHLARVASGLESPVTGEHEIVGQVSEALEAATNAGTSDGVLGRAGEAALRAGRQCRTETDIDGGSTGYGPALCNALDDALAAPPDRILLIGAGEMARTAARALRRRWAVTIDVANRSRAADLPTEQGRWWELTDLPSAVADADAIVSATAAEPPVVEETHARAAAGSPIVDLARPPDVSPSARDADGVHVIGLDELVSRINAAADRRESAVTQAESMITEAVDRFVASEREHRAEDTIRALHLDAKRIRDAEVERAKRRLEATEANEEAVLEDLATALTGRLLAQPTDEVRAAARERDEDTIRAVRTLFDLDDEDC